MGHIHRHIYPRQNLLTRRLPPNTQLVQMPDREPEFRGRGRDNGRGETDYSTNVTGDGEERTNWGANLAGGGDEAICEGFDGCRD